MFKIRLLRGGHADDNSPTAGYNVGDVFDSSRNLAKDDPRKFALVDDYEQEDYIDGDEDEDDYEDDLDEAKVLLAHSKEELLRYAEEKEIKVAKSATKPEIVEAILAAAE